MSCGSTQYNSRSWLKFSAQHDRGTNTEGNSYIQIDTDTDTHTDTHTYRQTYIHTDTHTHWNTHKQLEALSLSTRFNDHFPGGLGLDGTRIFPFWILLELRMTEVVVTTGAVRGAKLQSNHHYQQTNTQFFYRPDALPVAQPTVSKH